MKPGQFWGQCKNSKQSIKIWGDSITECETVPNTWPLSEYLASLSQGYRNLDKQSLGIKRPVRTIVKR